MIEELKTWSERVSLTKKDLDKGIFDDLIKIAVSRLEKNGYEDTFNYLQESYDKGKDINMVGVVLLRNNSKQIKDKLWSLNRKKQDGKNR